MPLAKCKKCGIEIPKGKKLTYSGKSYCQECYDDIKREKEELKRQSEEKKAKESEKKSQYTMLISTVCQYLNISKPTGLILRQIKDFTDQLGYTYSGIGYCLWYITTIEGKSFTQENSKYGIALVKYNYEKAKSYFNQQKRISNSVQELDYDVTAVNKVKVNLDKVYSKKNSFLFDLDELAKGDQ